MSLHVEAVRSKITVLATVYATKMNLLSKVNLFKQTLDINIVVFVQMAAA